VSNLKTFLAKATVSLTLLGLAACSRPSTEQLVELIKKDPSVLAAAIKKDPKAFRDVMQGAQDQIRRDRQKEQQEQQTKEQEERFAWARKKQRSRLWSTPISNAPTARAVRTR